MHDSTGMEITKKIQHMYRLESNFPNVGMQGAEQTGKQ